MFARQPNLFAVRSFMLAGSFALLAGCEAGHNVAASGSGASSSAPGTISKALAPPAGLKATPGNARASLTWSASSGATAYHVKRATTSGGPYTQVSAPSSTSYTDSSLTNGTTYYYVVSALAAAGESANSAQVSAAPAAPAAPPAAIPATPTAIPATAGKRLPGDRGHTAGGGYRGPPDFLLCRVMPDAAPRLILKLKAGEHRARTE